MFPNQITDVGATAVEVRDHLIRLRAERSLALGTELAEVRTYMDDLDEEIEVTGRLLVVTALTEIATLRAELFGAQHG
jgi:hypothetical protein